MTSLLNTSGAAERCTVPALLKIFVLPFRSLLARVRKECDFTKRMMNCGELGPPLTNRAQSLWERTGRFLSFCFVGRIELSGLKNLPTQKGPFVIAFNHSSSLDVAVVAAFLKQKARYPVDWRVTRAFGGLPIWLAGRCGCFSVDPENGKPALEALVKVLSSGENVVIFPEALIHPDGTFWPFKTGTVRAAKQASLNRGEVVPIIPAYMRYGRYPGEWVNKYVIWAQGLLQFFFPVYRRGVRVCIGEPINPLALPEDPKEATAVLQDAVFKLDPALNS